MVATEILDGQLVRDEVKGAVDLAPEDLVRRNQGIADNAGEVRFVHILREECEVGRVLVRITEESHREYQTGRVSDVTPVT